ncbi:hypothetical protein JGU66_03415 [Myxococcaceae bacterium JPH2]|nr:hypothetical protein [Myxococcaceae bacterium JPH2]
MPMFLEGVRARAARAAMLLSSLSVLVLAGQAQAVCPFTSIQARVQQNIQTSWVSTLSVSQGQTFNVASLKNDWGQLTDAGTTTLSVQTPSGAVTNMANNPTTLTATQTGTYTITANCQGLTSNVATVSVSSSPPVTYDMLDYMMNDNPSMTNELVTNLNQHQHFRAFIFAPGRFYITKNWNGTGADEFEELAYDTSYIYLVRDTSWQAANFCTAGNQTSFELWSNGLNRGAWIPRTVSSGSTYTTGPFEIKARYEGGTCQVCDSVSDSNGASNITRTIVTTHHATAPFNSALTDIMEVYVSSGPGAGEHYYFSKTLGWVGYTDPTPQTSYYIGPANGGQPFEIMPQDRCPIRNPDLETQATAQYGAIAYFGPNGGWASHTQFPKNNRSTLGDKFGFYAAGTTEVVSQRLDIRFQAGKTYQFRSFAQGGGDNTSLLPYEIGYANTDNDSNTWVLLQRTTQYVYADWVQTAGVSYTVPAGGAAVGKQVMIRFGPNGQSDAWFDNLTLTITP